eukprot:TRINITY_DN2567_c0_g1_i1.p1 TRINITY_DN2567_c0_g1~~TRINITY_DN2567_c0_g1_i1.p1  ORF type:complete len:251 (-),score=37.71 TRINITY_DN2567_c0_g1_i1:791-1543(-)
MNFSGKIVNVPIYVDKFNATKEGLVYFLSHFHSDHYSGLSNDFNRRLYCSDVTRELVLHHFWNINQQNVIALELMVKHKIMFIPCTSDNSEEDQDFVYVTFLPANHCPGSVMILLEGYFGKYLHTGDFRYNNDMNNYADILNAGGPIDRTYIDTTFASEFWENIPTKQNSTSEILRLIETRSSKAYVYIECDMLGTEDILLAIYERFGELIYVWEEKFYKLRKIPEIKDIITLGMIFIFAVLYKCINNGV